ncbi:hypothetical protein [Colwellia sp. E2M01]|nr:hypothetical protein [Colwellia sp. E2M01]MBU2870680.1 hypothetical protein [Colwellia sp. E2M01]
MLEHNGYTKAINDLPQNDLKVKVLELNRNKIKGKLTAFLGDLATLFNFN